MSDSSFDFDLIQDLALLMICLGHEAEHAPYEGQRYTPSPPHPNAPAGYPQENYFPATNSFPPPPNAGYGPPQGYNPADYPPPGAQAMHPDQYDYPPQGGYSPTREDPYAAGQGRGRRGDENVSAEPSLKSTAVTAPAATGTARAAADTPEEGGSGFTLVVL